MPFFIVAVAQGQSPFAGGIGDYLSHVGPVAAGVLLLLGVFSLVSWAVIIFKGLALRRAYADSRTFLDVFRKSSKFSEVNSVCAQLAASPLVGVFQAGYHEVNQQVRPPGKDAATPAKPTVRSLESLSRALVRAATVESTRLDRRLSFLASTASVTPFVGLFGTVWGIMNAFHGLGNVQQATLAMVAPGIAEALIATAMGLFAAIPAVIAYNRYADQVSRIELRYDTFVEELSTILQRHASTPRTGQSTAVEAHA